MERDRIFVALRAWREWRQAEAALHAASGGLDHWTEAAGAEFDRAYARKDAAWSRVAYFLDSLSTAAIRDE